MDIRLASPWFLTLLLVLPFLAVLTMTAWKRHKPAALRYADVGLAKPRFTALSWRVVARRLLPLGRIFALALMIVALSRPQIVNAQQIIKGEGVDISLAIDISGSMASLDFEPNNRLDAAKLVIEDFVAQRPYDRIGMTVFASEAFSQSPLTIDHNVVTRVQMGGENRLVFPAKNPSYFSGETAKAEAFGVHQPPLALDVFHFRSKRCHS